MWCNLQKHLQSMMGSFWLLLLYIQMLSPMFVGGVTRVYYLGIHEVNWNYAPTGKNVLANQSIAHNLYV
uniref:Uncharacterized protein n=1 Tax=Buteo japonicus TaxID=224669 RepID=A0A8C0B1Z9_9AVES